MEGFYFDGQDLAGTLMPDSTIESSVPHTANSPSLTGFVEYARRGGGLSAELAAELSFEFDEASQTLTLYGGQRAATLATHARIQSLLLRVHDYWYQGNSADIPFVELVLPESGHLH